mmetsp:Transcript_94675/g.287639  ORF Transcript_94675/g.287639 Transcript_94675/m.287639 type:complete len:249 (+) Transcript_94675:1970-2716(+)
MEMSASSCAAWMPRSATSPANSTTPPRTPSAKSTGARITSSQVTPPSISPCEACADSILGLPCVARAEPPSAPAATLLACELLVCWSPAPVPATAHESLVACAGSVLGPPCVAGAALSGATLLATESLACRSPAPVLGVPGSFSFDAALAASATSGAEATSSSSPTSGSRPTATRRCSTVVFPTPRRRAPGSRYKALVSACSTQECTRGAGKSSWKKSRTAAAPLSRVCSLGTSSTRMERMACAAPGP